MAQLLAPTHQRSAEVIEDMSRRSTAADRLMQASIADIAEGTLIGSTVRRRRVRRVRRTTEGTRIRSSRSRRRSSARPQRRRAPKACAAPNLITLRESKDLLDGSS